MSLTLRSQLLLLLLLLAAVFLHTDLQQQQASALCTGGDRKTVIRPLGFQWGKARCSRSRSSSITSSNSNSSSSSRGNTFSPERTFLLPSLTMEGTQRSLLASRRTGDAGRTEEAGLLWTSPGSEDVPEETPPEVKKEIRRRRLADPLSPSRVLANDCLRIALMGPQEYSAFVTSSSSSSSSAAATAAAAAAAEIGRFSVPVWVMRQAGRYLPEFRALRAKHSFLTVCRDPLLAANVSLQPFIRFPLLDAVIIFSDILVLPEAMGMPLSVEDGEGPRFSWRLESPDDIQRLDVAFDVEDRLGYVFDAIYATAERLEGKIPIIGFSGGPLTLFCYMVEGGAAKKGWTRAKEFLFQYPKESLLLLQQIAAAATKFLVKQVEAGAQVLQVFDTIAGVFAPEQYEEFGAPFMSQIAQDVSAFYPGLPLIAFSKDYLPKSFLNSSFSAVSASWGLERSLIKERFHAGAALRQQPVALSSKSIKAIQGNLDPQILYAPDHLIRRETERMVRDFQPGRYVANLGHGMEPWMDPHKLGVFLQAVKDTAADIKRQHQSTLPG